MDTNAHRRPAHYASNLAMISFRNNNVASTYCVLEALVAWPFKRKYPRVNLVVQAEMRSSAKNYPCRGRTVTVGEGGCYIEVLETLEPSTTVDVVLWLNGEKVLAKAEVASNDRHIGNGLKFVSMAREDAQKLKTFLKVASQETVPTVRVDTAVPVFEVTRFTPASA
jgi:PilZ domain-containing protein